MRRGFVQEEWRIPARTVGVPSGSGSGRSDRPATPRTVRRGEHSTTSGPPARVERNGPACQHDGLVEQQHNLASWEKPGCSRACSGEISASAIIDNSLTMPASMRRIRGHPC